MTDGGAVTMSSAAIPRPSSCMSYWRQRQLPHRIDVKPINRKNAVMKRFVQRSLAGLIGASALTSCQGMGTTPQEFDVSGQAIDVTTGKPLAGVFMVAIHQRAGGVAFAHSGIWCVKTVGQYTDGQGRFRFSYEKGHEPEFLFIKPGYYPEFKPQDVNGIPQQWPRPPGYKDYDKNYRNPHQHVNVYLRPQDPTSPRFNYGDDRLCDRATSLEDVQPMIEFLKIEIEELRKYGVDPKIVKSHEDSIELQSRLVESNRKRK